MVLSESRDITRRITRDLRNFVNMKAFETLRKSLNVV